MLLVVVVVVDSIAFVAFYYDHHVSERKGECVYKNIKP